VIPEVFLRDFVDGKFDGMDTIKFDGKFDGMDTIKFDGKFDGMNAIKFDGMGGRKTRSYPYPHLRRYVNRLCLRM